jgi:hypothetical protein
VSEALRQGTVLAWNLAFSAAAVLAGWWLVSLPFATGVFVGSALEVANFRALWTTAERTFGAGAGAAVGGFALRFVLLGVAIALAIGAGIHAAGLLVGLSLMVPAIAIAALRARPPIEPDLPALPPDHPDWDRYNVWLARERRSDEDDEDPS